MRILTRGRRASLPVYGILLMLIMTCVIGVVFYGFVEDNVYLAKSLFSAQMSDILVRSVIINSTHIIAWLQNNGAALIEITGAYVNGLVSNLVNIANIAPGSIGAASMLGIFMQGYTYTVKLLSTFNTVVSFDIKY
jgi:hypothetical protein